ncbi:class I SAM-dependent methyltransferase [Brooklawnia sp.]|uniref:class I SAM-dependent methyltransferase n=1 Tax=Brooklawnia sp. TaxID=2699740 RepID=UPI00311D496F
MSEQASWDERVAATEAAMAEADPESLGAAARLRARFAPEVAAFALTQASLRRKARTKFGDRAATRWFTRDGLEQASRSSVAAWRAERFRAAGVRRVIDLGCGIGSDALAFLDAGLDVVAVEADPLTAELARANLPGAEVICGDATLVGPRLLASSEPATGVFVDPGRRTAAGRSWRVADFSPSWDFVLGLLDSGLPICVKLGPGVPRELIPDGVEACWVSDRGDVVEAGLWRLGPEQAGASAAVLLPDDDRIEADPLASELVVAAPGRFLLDPNGAVIRAKAIGRISPRTWLLHPEVAYSSSDEFVETPFASCFEVLETLDFNVKVLKAWVRTNKIGTLEIKKRAVDIDPAQLRRSLKPSGPNAATLIIARTTTGTKALVCRRL